MSQPASIQNSTFIPTLKEWWRQSVAHAGRLSATKTFLSALWQFARESTPGRARQRFGDIDYDWEHRVNTTSANTGWRERLLGALHSPYQPTEPSLFREMMSALELDFSQFTFVDVGSGKGRVLLMASEYPFRSIIGVELLPELHNIAVANIQAYVQANNPRARIASLCGDAVEFAFPDGPLLLYLFNPLPIPSLRAFVANLGDSISRQPRPVYVLYHNPLLQSVLLDQEWLTRVGGTHQYLVFKTMAGTNDHPRPSAM